MNEGDRRDGPVGAHQEAAGLTVSSVHPVDQGRAGRARRRGRLLALAAAPVALALALAACSSGSSDGTAKTGSSVSGSATSSGSGTPSTSPSSSTPATPATLAVHPSTGTKNVNPAKPITVTATGGTIGSVTLVNVVSGVHVSGKLSSDGTSWTSTEDLGYGKKYRLTASAKNADGSAGAKARSTFTTLTPGNQTLPYLDDIYGAALKNNGTYGVAMVPVVHFDEPISNRKAAEKALIVTTSPHVDGSWYWTDDQNVHWRPENFYTPGTKVTIDAKVYGVRVGPGLYGQSDEKVSFNIGRKQVTQAYDSAPKVDKVKVFRWSKDGTRTLMRTMNTSMGEHSGETVNGQYINFYTLDGTYTVLGFENPASMCSDSYGLPADAPGGYACEDIPWSTKISTDGIYLHELDTTIWAQNSGDDVSHGCLNLDHSNAEWFFKHSLVGDPVIVHGAKGAPKLKLWEGGDWTLSWKQWQQGSALS